MLGLPEMRPVEPSSTSPAGGAPALTMKVMGAVPDAVTVAEHAVPAVAVDEGGADRSRSTDGRKSGLRMRKPESRRRSSGTARSPHPGPGYDDGLLGLVIDLRRVVGVVVGGCDLHDIPARSTRRRTPRRRRRGRRSWTYAAPVGRHGQVARSPGGRRPPRRADHSRSRTPTARPQRNGTRRTAGFAELRTLPENYPW